MAVPINRTSRNSGQRQRLAKQRSNEWLLLATVADGARSDLRDLQKHVLKGTVGQMQISVCIGNICDNLTRAIKGTSPAPFDQSLVRKP